jgi:predicted aspartyl protease
VAPKNSIFLIFYRSISDRLPPLPQQQTPQSKNCDSLQTDSEVAAREFIISSISISKTDDSWFVTVFIDGVPVDFKVDTGAQCNVHSLP